MKANTARNFTLQLGAFIALYVSLVSFLALVFGLINIYIPDPIENYWHIESATHSIRFAIAVLIISFPTYLILTRKIQTLRRKTEDSHYLALTKWLLYLSLLVAAGVLLGDLVSVIYAFLNGDITLRFILKVATIFIVIGAAFYYYIHDVREYWNTHEKQSLTYAGILCVCVVAAIVLGFFNIETPAEVREHRIDEEAVNDLQIIQGNIESYYVRNEMLPESLADLSSPSLLPTAPDTRDAYTYTTTEKGFVLCAEFAYDTEDLQLDRPYIEKDALIANAYEWDHTAGNYCFDRVVNK